MFALGNGPRREDVQHSTPQEQVQQLGGPAAYVESPVVSIDRAKKTVTTEDGKTIAYSKLVLAAAGLQKIRENEYS